MIRIHERLDSKEDLMAIKDMLMFIMVIRNELNNKRTTMKNFNNSVDIVIFFMENIKVRLGSHFTNLVNQIIPMINKYKNVEYINLEERQMTLY